ncbi:G2/mitotic-specific cyclin S13-7-like isoform X1 [Elaeis guineensis]|uniref:G2/mitotic-specific cyclin S13-7-like isoform X1 n=1 Tax=Elaeis guineensis var. tenera TaxID=51953 RepID=UPI003C6D0BB0
MALMHYVVVPQHQRGDGPIPTVKQKAAAGGDGKNRRALGDIGNPVMVRGVEGKPQPQISRPVTRWTAALRSLNYFKRIALSGLKHPIHSCISRSSGAHLPANAKLATIATAHKNPVVVAVDVAVGKGSAVEPEEITEMSPDITEPKDHVHDIDALDAHDQLAVVDYVEDIYKFYKLAENSHRPNDYMESQVEINEEKRAILAEWLIEVHHKFGLMPEILYLTFYIFDRYLSMETVRRRELPLVGVSAMLIACKYEDIRAAEVSNFICILDSTYSREQILSKEKEILNKLEWNLTVPTPYMFLVRFLKAAMADKEMEHLAFFFAELGLMHYSMIMYCPSLIAASAVYAARCTLKKTPFWTETLKHHTGFSELQLLDCAQHLVSFHSKAAETELKVVFSKYSSPQCGAVALHPPATKLLDELKAALIHDWVGVGFKF